MVKDDGGVACDKLTPCKDFESLIVVVLVNFGGHLRLRRAPHFGA